MDSIVLQKLYVTDTRGNVNVYNPGDTIKKNVTKKLNNIQLSKIVEMVRKNQVWTDYEYNVLLDVYELMTSKNNTDIVDYYNMFQDVTNSDRSFGSIVSYFCIVRKMDNTSHYTGFNNPSQKLLDIAIKRNPQRYDNTLDVTDKLDALLDDILKEDNWYTMGGPTYPPFLY